ncbi:MAG: OmpA family protein [Bacteroidales bacterium]|nr:OmpA family protein [Bacteroidales bacterium]
MKNLKSISVALLLAASVATPAMAQSAEKDYEPIPYTFVSVQGGVQNVIDKNYNNWKTFTPTAAISLGHFFSPGVGARLNVNGIWNKGCATTYTNETAYYKYNYVTTDVDALLNLSTLFSKKQYCPVNFYLIGGFGWYRAWDNKEALALSPSVPDMVPTYVEKDKRDAVNCRMGAQLDVNLCKNVAFNIEATYNRKLAQEKTFARDNDHFLVMAGLNFKFGYKKKPIIMVDEPEPEVWETRIDTTWYDDISYKDVVKPGDIDKRIFFNLKESDVESTDAQIAAVAEFLKGVQNGEVTITAYADAGTGNPKLNMEYSKQRAEKTKAALIEKGVDPSIIKSVEWKGDTVQPYPNDNDKNRVSIITGKGVYKQQEKVVNKKFKTSERRVRVQ